MRGDDREPDAMFSYVSAEQRVPKEHPLRAIRALVDEVLRDMSREFDGLYARVGRPSIPPERLLRAQLLQIFYSIRSERLLMEQLDYNLLFRWFVGMDMDEPIWAPTVFSKNRDRLLNQDIARSFFRRVVERAKDLMSDGAFHGRWHADRRVGEPEEFSAEGRRHRRGRRRLSRAAAEERHARVDDGSRRAVVSPVESGRIAPGVPGPPADRESPRIDRRCHGQSRGRLRGTRGRHADDAEAVGDGPGPPPDARR
jgi:transposase